MLIRQPAGKLAGMNNWRAERIDRMWFRTRLPLQALAEKLLLAEIERDYENVWEWVIGKFGDVPVDICREHAPPRMKVETTRFEVENGPLSPSVIEALVERLRPLVVGPIVIGQRGSMEQPEVRVHEFAAASTDSATTNTASPD